MLTAIFRRCLNLPVTLCTHAKGGEISPSPHRGARADSIARQAVRTIGTAPERAEMTPSYARYLSLLAALLLLAAPPVTAQIDYDTNDNRLIEIDSAAKLNAIRYDSDGNGVVTTSDSANYAATGDGFPSPSSTQCPTSCLGYELTADIDLSGYTDWAPIASTRWGYTATFDGNGHTISNLTIGTAVSGNTDGAAGLFGLLASTGSILRVGVTGANVYGGAARSQELGILAGESRGVIRFSYTTGVVTSAASGPFHKTGGLVGHLREGGTISASYSTAAVNGPTIAANAQVTGGLVGQTGGTANTNTGTITAAYASGGVSAATTATNGYLGGLVGYNFRGGINQSYAYGSVSPTRTTNYSGGLVGRTESWGTETDSYYDSTTSGQSDTGKGVGHPTANLQGPINYGSGIYSSWNTNVDGVSGADDPWDFGAVDQYPVLKVGRDAAAIAAQFAAQPLGVPQNVMVTSSLDTLIVRWVAVRQATGYKVQWKSGGQNYPSSDEQTSTRGQATVSGGNTTTYPIRDLTPGTPYTVRVIATTERDGMPSSEVIGILSVSIPDAGLRAVIEDSLNKATGAVITPAEMATLTRLIAPNKTIRDLTGLEFATGLDTLNLSDNNIEDIEPLVNNAGLGTGAAIDLRGNPLNDQSRDVHIPALEARGVSVHVQPTTNMDVDADGTADLTDAIMVILYLFGLENEGITNYILFSQQATRTDPEDVTAYIKTLINTGRIDIDADGTVDLTDIIMVILYIFGLENEGITNYILFSAQAQRTDPQAVTAYIASLLP